MIYVWVRTNYTIERDKVIFETPTAVSRRYKEI